MSSLVAKRYVKALLVGQSTNDIVKLYNEIKNIASAYSDEKFLSIIASTDVTTDSKVELISSFVINNDNKVTNLLKLLANNKRLNIVPSIADELKKEMSQLSNSYEGIVYTNVALSDNELEAMSDKFAKKFNITLALTQNVCEYDGIKVDIDSLGVEIGFSKDRFRSQMIDHILKAV